MKKSFLSVTLIFLAGLTLAHGAVQDGHNVESQITGQSSGKIQYATEEICPNEKPGWRNASTISGVEILKSERCSPDNPYTVAASVKGTNHVGMKTLMKSGLSGDAVIKGNDTDGDGDPDRIHITHEIAGINEENQSNIDYEIAPGVKPAFWAFAPKTRGMVEEDSRASNLIRMPSPSIRIEQGDKVFLEVENTHYMPHTVHLHGVDHAFNSSNISEESSGNDGVPAISEKPIKPGESRTYEIQPRKAGEMMYHCHVVPAVHVQMGLAGIFIVEEEADNNTVQTLNVGAGKVRHMPEKDQENNFEAEYDLVYQSLDKEVHEISKNYSDTRKISREIQREHDATDANSDYYILNGKSFPYTARESIIPVEKDEKYRLNTLNIGPDPISLHPHGHKITKTSADGVKLENPVQRDVFTMSAAQRATFTLDTTDNGLDSYGSGAWIMHDHTEPAVTTDGISPGGNIGMIVYERYLGKNGVPEVAGNLRKFFSASYYEGEIPYFQNLDPDMFGSVPGASENLSTSSESSGQSEMSMMSGMDSGMMMDMEMRDGGVVVNENTNKLPPGCSEVSGNESLYVEAGNRYAAPGNAFEYSTENYNLGTCERVTVEVKNLDEVRHQWMLHGLPEEVYPMGMFNIEVEGGESVEATFITPSDPQKLNLHCSLPQHEQKGMHGTVNIEDKPELSQEERPFWRLLQSIL